MARPVSVVFIHGLANKPEPSELRRIWLEALARSTPHDGGFDLEAEGVTPELVYWADLFYDEPLPASDYESAASQAGQLAAMVGEEALPEGNAEWLANLADHYPEAFSDAPASLAQGDASTTPADLEYERIPLPAPVKKKMMRALLREAHDYLYDRRGVRQTIRGRVLEALSTSPDDARRVLVGHSQGTFIAYDLLTGVDACPPIDGMLTLGSPLGVDEVQDRLSWSRDDGFPAKLRGDWVNVYDTFDAVARPDPKLANDFRRRGESVVIDANENNWGRWRHSATKYFRGPKLRAHLRRLCGR